MCCWIVSDTACKPPHRHVICSYLLRYTTLCTVCSCVDGPYRLLGADFLSSGWRLPHNAGALCFWLCGFFNLCVNRSWPFVSILSHTSTHICLRPFSIFVLQHLDLVSALFPHQILCTFKSQCKGRPTRLQCLKILEPFAYLYFENCFEI